MRQDYYKEYVELERNHWWFRARREILRDLIEDRSLVQGEKRILNVGAATGASSQMLAEFGHVQSLEIDPDCCDFLRDCLSIQVDQGSVIDLPYADDSMDLICAFDVLEHVERDRLGFEEMMRVCRPGGYIFVTVPALQWLWSEHDEINHHFRRYRKAQLLSLSGGTGQWMYHSYFNMALFIPIAVYRLISRYVLRSRRGDRDEGMSDFNVAGQTGVVQKILYAVFKSENVWIRKGRSFPFGLSVMGVWQKPL